MEGYPTGYMQHNLPVLLLFGVDERYVVEDDTQRQRLLQDGGFIIKSESLPVSGERIQGIIQELQRAVGSSGPWRAKAPGHHSSSMSFHIKITGRKYILPPRKAPPPRDPLESTPLSSPKAPSPPSWALHSPLSPLSSESPVFPDGLMTNLWMMKHQEYLPSTVMSVFAIKSDIRLNTLNDNQLKTDINQIGSTLRSSGYKTRHVVLIISDGTTLETPDLEERLASIRRATGLDSKNSLFFLPPDAAPGDTAAFVRSMLGALQPSCVEYYRDLTKHARRKKARGTIPPPTIPPTKGTSQVLGLPGWNIRYEVKLGIFAEYRQEMDAAGRHYSAALDGLLSTDGLFETTASWSPRWDEARLLSDGVSFRLIRTLLWNGSTTQAVQYWLKYRDRVRELVDKHGKGSSNYGWEAWESRWAKLMAELIQRADLPVFSTPAPAESQTILERIIHIFAPPEKAIPLGERLPPWHLLHHPGYWHKLSATHADRRRELADKMAEEDRLSPAQSPAAQVARRHGTYDTYLCPQPHEENPLEGEQGYDHTSDITTKLQLSGKEFVTRDQQRFADQIKLEQARQLLKAKHFDKAFSILESLYREMRWRKEQWWTLVYRIIYYLHVCALECNNEEFVILTMWELLSDVFPTRKEENFDLMTCLKSRGDVRKDQPAVSVFLRDENVVSFLSVTLTFLKTEGHVADRVECQLALTSRAKKSSKVIVFSDIEVNLEGSLDRLELKNSSTSHNDEPRNAIFKIDQLESETSGSKLKYRSLADLKLAPGQTKIFAFDLVFREAGDVRPLNTILTIDTEDFRLEYDAELQFQDEIVTWWQDRPRGLQAKRLGRREENFIKILPKPPKMEISLRNLKDAYFTNENIVIEIEIENLEDEETEVTLEVRFLYRDGGRVAYSWLADSQAGADRKETLDSLQSPKDLPGHVVGNLDVDAVKLESMAVIAPLTPAECVLEIKALYHLLSDLDTPISKTFTVDISFVSPFEANYDFSPRVHPDPWPNYFLVHPLEGEETDDGNESQKAFGLAQKWCLVSRIASFTDEPVNIQDASLILNAPHGGIICSIEPQEQSAMSKISPQEMIERRFTIDVQKLSLEDKRTAALELSLQIKWQRIDSDDTTSGNTSTLIVPRLTIPNSEPRVLATAIVSPTNNSLVHLSYVLENPSMHFLTFDLTMEASEEFAISGPKAKSCNILPMTRQVVSYNLLPLVSGAWISPKLNVVDRHFNKTLKVLGTEGVKVDKKGLSVWVDATEDDE